MEFRRVLFRSDLRGGAQPMLTPDGKVAITFNGEIYNFREVRTELLVKGHAFRSESDTEVILAAWREWGPDCLSRLQGMFVFALCDAAADTLFLARDRLGVKPLYYVELADGALIFASELKGFLAHPSLRRGISAQAVDDYLAFGYVPDDACIVESVSKLSAGHYLLVRRGRNVPKPASWWDVDFSNPLTGTADALDKELTDIMRKAVRSPMLADVPLGAFLPRGVDTHSAVALVAHAS